MEKLSIIYEPKGKAKEYADLACNIYRGCTHGCKYCFGSRFDKEEYYKAANPKDNILERIKHDLQILTQELGPANIPEILFSFQGDPYQPAEMNYKYMAKIIPMLIEHEVKFTILTKGGRLAVRDFPLIQGYSGFRFGSTIVFTDQHDADHWEPNAASLNDRWVAVAQASMYGFPTWVSLEPVINPDQALEIIQNYHHIVDHWKIGKINYFPEIERYVDWKVFREQARELLDSLKASYYFKKSLSEL